MKGFLPLLAAFFVLLREGLSPDLGVALTPGISPRCQATWVRLHKKWLVLPNALSGSSTCGRTCVNVASKTTTTTPTTDKKAFRFTSVAFSFVVSRAEPLWEAVVVMMAAHEAQGGGTSSARRRRERRLRAYLRYARMSVAMALAETQHHSAQRQKRARAWEEEREVLYTAVFRTFLLPIRSSSASSKKSWTGGRPGSVTDPAPQGRVERHTAAHIDILPFVQILDVPVPQLEGPGGGTTRRRLTSRVSPCPRPLWTRSHNAARVVDRGEQNSWWECLRSYPTLLYSSGLPSRSLTFLFLVIVVAGAVEAFKVSLKDRVQQRLVEQNSSTFQFLKVVVGGSFEKAFKVSRKDRVQQRAVEQNFPTFQFLRVVAGRRSSRFSPRPEFSCFILALLCRG